MKTLIIGGTSSLGQALKPTLSAFSEVITAGRKGCDLTIDLRDPMNKIVLPGNIDVVIHTAAHFGGETDEEILAAEDVNVLGTLKLCQASVKAKAKSFILISSLSACLQETSLYYSMYALSKKQTEEVARFYCAQHSLPLTILRPSQLYGNEDSFRRHQPFIYNIIDNAIGGKDITIYGSKDPHRNYIYVDDFMNIIIKVIQHRIEGTYSCMYPSDVTYTQIAKAALKAFHSNGKIHFLKNKEDIPDNIFEKDASLYKKIDFHPQVSIEEGMKKIAHYRKLAI